MNTATVLRPLVFEETTFEETAHVLSLINPKGYSADFIMSRARQMYDTEPDTTYFGTAGWYVVFYPSSDGSKVNAKAMLMPYAVKRWLSENGY